MRNNKAQVQVQVQVQKVTSIAGVAHSGASIEDMIRAASDTVAEPGGTPAGETGAAPSGVQIERQDIEHVRGQAKSGNTLLGSVA